jgi:Glycosyl transferase family 2
MSQDPPLERLDQRAISIAPADATAILCVQNEALRLPWLFSFYRSQGVSRFLVIDNLSDDGTTEWLRAQDDAHVFLARGSYSRSLHGTHWVNEVLDSHLADRWALVVDADEVLTYPLAEQLNIVELCAQLDAWRAELLFAFMLDCYGDGPAAQSDYQAGAPFPDANPLFDPGPYYIRAAAGQMPPFSVRGGVRHRAFDWSAARTGAPRLRKVPLVKWRKGDAYLGSTHQITGKALAPITGALLHYKFLGAFADRIRADAARPDRPDAGAHYDSYVAGLDADAALTLADGESMRLAGTMQLIELGLIGLPRRAAADWFGRLKAAGMPVAERNVLWRRLKAALDCQKDAFSPQIGHFLQLFDDLDPAGGGFKL